MPGTGLPIDFGLQTTSGAAVVVATDASTFCTDTMLGSISVYIAPIPTVYTISAGGAYCEGSAGFDLTLSGSDTGVVYQVYNGASLVGSVFGTGLPLDLGSWPAGSYTVTGINYSSGLYQCDVWNSYGDYECCSHSLYYFPGLHLLRYYYRLGCKS